MDTVNLLRQLHTDMPHYLGMFLWLITSAWLGRKLAVRWHRLVLLYSVALLSWVSPGILRTIIQNDGVYHGGFSITWAIVAPPVVIPLVCWRRRQTLGSLGASVLLPIPTLGAFAKLGCFYNACCACEISVAPGVLPCARQFSHLPQPRDPCQLYEAILLLCLGVVFVHLFRRYGSSSRFILMSLSLLAIHKIVIQYYRSGFGGGADTRWTPLHHPLVAVGAIAVCLVLLVVLRPRITPAGAALIRRLSRPWLPAPVTVGAVMLLSGVTVPLVVWERREDQAAAWSKRATSSLVRTDHQGRTTGAGRDGTDFCVAASNYNCLSGFFSWKGICHELRALYLAQQWAARPSYDGWSAVWDLDPYRQRHIDDLVGAYEGTGDVLYLRTAIEHVSYWLAFVEEEKGGVPLWPDNIAALSERTQAWRRLLSALDDHGCSVPGAWKAEVQRRLAFYVAYMERKRGTSPKETSAPDVSPAGRGDLVIECRAATGEQGSGARRHPAVQAMWLVLDEQGGKTVAFLWWLLFCTAFVASCLKPGLACPMVTAGSFLVSIALLFDLPGTVWACLSGIALCGVGGALHGRVSPRAPALRRGGLRAALLVFCAGGILMGIRHNLNAFLTSRETAQVCGTARRFLSAWDGGDTEALARLTTRAGLSLERSKGLLDQMSACLRFAGMPTIETITWRSPTVARVTFRTTVQTRGTGKRSVPRLSGFFEIPPGDGVIEQPDAVRHLILVKKHGQWLVPM